MRVFIFIAIFLSGPAFALTSLEVQSYMDRWVKIELSNRLSKEYRGKEKFSAAQMRAFNGKHRYNVAALAAEATIRHFTERYPEQKHRPAIYEGTLYGLGEANRISPSQINSVTYAADVSIHDYRNLAEAFRKIVKVLGPDHPSVQLYRNNLGSSLALLTEFAKTPETVGKLIEAIITFEVEARPVNSRVSERKMPTLWLVTYNLERMATKSRGLFTLGNPTKIHEMYRTAIDSIMSMDRNLPCFEKNAKHIYIQHILNSHFLDRFNDSKGRYLVDTYTIKQIKSLPEAERANYKSLLSELEHRVRVSNLTEKQKQGAQWPNQRRFDSCSWVTAMFSYILPKK